MEPKAAEDISRRLKEELDAANGVVPPIRFDTAHPVQEVPMPEGYEKIAESVFVEDPYGNWKRLEEELRLGDRRSDAGSVARALDEACVNAREAYQLYVSALRTKLRWELDNQVVHGALWSEATESLQREKDAKQRAKVISNEDVKARIAQLFPDEYRHQELAKQRVELMAKSLENLAKAWSDRLFALRSIAERLR